MTLRLRTTLLMGAVGGGLVLVLAPLVTALGWVEAREVTLFWPYGAALGVATVTVLAAWPLLGRWARAAEAAATAEQAFLGRVSHELRRPLAALRGELELAVRRPREVAALRKAIAHALEDAERMSRLVDDLLFHARTRAGRLDLVREEVGLVDLVYAAVDRTQRALARAPASLRVEALPDVRLRVDASRVSQAIENLVANAHAHGGDHADVVVRGEVSDAGIALHVEDDGPGVPEADQEAIFEPFGRADSAPTQGGTGLGLSIARSAVQAHGGTLTLVSPRPGHERGACFTIRLPATCRAEG